MGGLRIQQNSRVALQFVEAGMLQGLYKVEMRTVHGSGTYTDDGAVAEATALAGKRRIRFSAVLKKMAEA